MPVKVAAWPVATFSTRTLPFVSTTLITLPSDPPVTLTVLPDWLAETDELSIRRDSRVSNMNSPPKAVCCAHVTTIALRGHPSTSLTTLETFRWVHKQTGLARELENYTTKPNAAKSY